MDMNKEYKITIKYDTLDNCTMTDLINIIKELGADIPEIMNTNTDFLNRYSIETSEIRTDIKEYDIIVKLKLKTKDKAITIQ